MTETIKGIQQEIIDLEKESDILSGLWLDLSVNIQDPEPIIKQGEVNMCTLGNFSCVTGQAKSRKTFLISAITGAFLCPDEFMGMAGTTDTGIALYIDTEQSTPHVQKVIRRIHRIAGFEERENNERLKVLCLRELDPQQRKTAVIEAINRIQPALCIIDGVADLMEDTNSNMESVSIATLLLKLTSQYNCHILTAIHTNPGSDKARGHIGSEITRKAETVVNVSKNGDVSMVKADYCRDIEIQDFSFIINAHGLPELSDIKPISKPKTSRMRALFDQILPYPQTLTNSDLVAKIMQLCDVEKRAAQYKISNAMKAGVITQNKMNLYHIKQDVQAVESELPF